jgi:uncharacterized protein YbjT (DUF2867 family)
MTATPEIRRVLVTGASGYVGSRLVTMLLAQGVLVRVLVRDLAKIVGQPWYSKVEVAVGSATNYLEIYEALKDVHTTFYLLHSIGAGPRFDEIEKKMALTFGQAAHDCGVSQIIYLGGIVSSGGNKASQHLASRANTGTGLASFQVTPKWVSNRTQPIAIRDVLYYLTQAAHLPEPLEGVYDIGGPNIFTYGNLLKEFAKVAKLRRRIIIKVPFLSVWLSSLWIGLVTPVPVALARPLVGSLINESVVDQSHSISQIIPPPPSGLLPVERAFELAISKVEHHEVESRWSDANSFMPPWQKTQSDPAWAGEAEYHDEQITYTEASLTSLWQSIEEIGGDRGWYGADGLWWLRGLLDRLLGGVGLRRGRRDPLYLRQGESLDFWRVESLRANHELTLYAEMILPGKAWLQFTVDEVEHEGQTVRRLNQRASFQPKGIGGHLYWGIVLPFHRLIFPKMARNILKEAVRKDLVAGNTTGEVL